MELARSGVLVSSSAFQARIAPVRLYFRTHRALIAAALLAAGTTMCGDQATLPGAPSNLTAGIVIFQHVNFVGKAAHIEVGAFLGRGGHGPEHRELLRLIGTLVERDHSFERGTAARIKSHAKSHIVELTDSSKWRIWYGDLARTL